MTTNERSPGDAGATDIERQLYRESAIALESLARRLRAAEEAWPQLRSDARSALRFELERHGRRVFYLIFRIAFSPAFGVPVTKEQAP